MFEAFRNSDELRAELKKSFVKMCWFYGFIVKDVPREEAGDTGDGGVAVCILSLFLYYSFLNDSVT